MIKVLPGKIPEAGFESGDNAFKGTKVAIITRVDTLNSKADVKVLTGGGEYFELDLPQPLVGPRSFLGGFPEKDSLVNIGFRRKHKQLFEAVILNYIQVGVASGNRFDPFSNIDPSEVSAEDKAGSEKLFGKTRRYKRIQGESGDILGMSSSGAEMVLSKDVKFVNRAGDLLELRDGERTLVTQSIHKVHSDSAIYTFSGGARRSALNLPTFAYVKDKDGNPTKILKGETNRYFGRDELADVGNPKYCSNTSTGAVLDRLNNDEEFPPVVYSNGRHSFYPTNYPGTGFEDDTGSGRVFTEARMELRHDTDLRQSVLEEIDGFTPEAQPVFIEQVYGTVIGNDSQGSQGIRQYGKVLKPKIFEDFSSSKAGTFALDETNRSPGVKDEAMSMAGAYLFKMKPTNTETPFAISVSKQGKLFANIPGSQTENYLQKNISAEVNMQGALKMHLGASTPDRVSLHLVMEGGALVEYGADANGNSISSRYRGAVKNTYAGGNNTDGVAHSHSVVGNSESTVTGNQSNTVQGAYDTRVDGSYTVQASDVAVRSLNGYSVSTQSLNTTVVGKSQYTYAMLVQETIAVGGRVTTILAGGDIKNILAGACTTTVTAGATAFNNPAGAFSVNVGAGALSLTTAAGALTLTAGAGAISMTSGTAMTLTAGLALNITSTVTSILSPQILLGGPAAVFGVVRGVPSLPPGTPTLDYITGLPLLGSALVRSV